MYVEYECSNIFDNNPANNEHENWFVSKYDVCHHKQGYVNFVKGAGDIYLSLLFCCLWLRSNDL